MDYIQLLHDGSLVEAELSNINRDLISVNCTSKFNFNVGDTITCFYAKRRFETRVIQIHQSAIYLFPTKPEAPIRQPFRMPEVERRQYPRFEVNMHAIFFNELDIIDAQIIDLSRTGLGISSMDGGLEVDKIYNAMIQYADLAIAPRVRIKHVSENNGEFRYGGEFVSMNAEDSTRLQFFILSRQLNIN